MAKVNVFFDYFNGATLDGVKWLINRPPGTPDVNSTVTVAGGKVTINQATTALTLQSQSAHDWQNSSVIFGAVTGPFSINASTCVLGNTGTNVILTYNFGGTTVANITYNAATMKYFKYVGTASAASWYYSADNITYTLIGTAPVVPPTSYPFAIGTGRVGTLTIEAINPVPPTIELVSPGDLTQLTTPTPALVVKATDPQGDTVTYQIQVSTDNTFTTTDANATSGVDPGFSGTNPYAQNTNVTYTMQTPLTPGAITYFWRARAKDQAGSELWSPWSATSSMISEPNPPTITSGTSSAIAATTATTGGEITNDGGATISERGVAYGTSANPTTAGTKKTVAGTTGAFNANLTDLTANTVYNWRAYATNSKATSYGDNKTFTTLPATSTITGVSSVTDTSAIVAVTVPAGGGATITERGVVYSTVTNPTTASNKVTSGSGSGTFTANLTGLTGLTTYYVKAYVINAQGTTYSTESSFTTLQTPSAPTVTTGTASAITPTTADFNGSAVTLDGTLTVTERGIVLSKTNDDPTVADTKVIAGAAGLGSYNLNLTALSPESLYYARAYAINSMGVGYGPIVTFTTLALFIPEAGDGYWSWKTDGSNVTVSRNQPTPANSSANMMLSQLGLVNGQQYTLQFGSVTSDQGAPSVVLQWYDNLVKQQQVITAGVPYTFTYDTSKLSWAIRLFVTGATPEPDNIEATFNDFYLAQESTFSEYVPFKRKGLTEIRLDNNWLLDKRREETIEDIFDEIHNIGWRQFKARTTGLGWLEVGDRFTITDDQGTREVIAWETSLTVDGGIKETISAESPTKTETDYNKAGTVTKSLRRTQISVDHNEQLIESLVEDVHSVDGVVNTKFSEVEQDIESVRTTVQSSGGVNLVRNSVMYSFSDDGVPDYWEVAGTGVLTIQASPESLSGGGISGNVFTLSNETVSQNVTVRKDVDFIAQDQKLYYSLSARVRKNTVGAASITLSNRNETHIIDLPDQTEYYWEAVSIEGLLPLDDHYDITIQSDADANLQVTDVMLSPGENVRQWTQSNGEAMNTNVAITDDGMTIRSNVFRNDYVRIDALGFEVHKHEAGGERVFGFNGDETNVRKLRADNQLSIATIRMVPVQYDSYNGIAFTRTEDN